MTVREWISRQPRRVLIIAAVAGVAVAGAWWISLDALLVARLGRDGIATPTRIYSRPVVLQAGLRADRDRIVRHLRRLGYRESRTRNVGIGEYRLGGWEWTIGVRPFRLADRLASGGVARIALDWDDRVASITDETGASTPYLTLEPALLRTVGGPDLADRVLVAIEEVPRHLTDAILTTEDRRFFQHSGLDVARIGGAAFANVEAGRITQGASTITQQLVRSLWLSPDRNPVRKLREAAMALVLEQRHSKEEILEAYLNEVYLGQDGALAIRGVGRAAQFYFGKDVTQLEVDESALLAGIIRAPSLYAPFRHPEAAKERRTLVLDLMRARDVITEQAHRATMHAPLGLRVTPEASPLGRHFTTHVMRELERHVGRSLRSGMTVITTLDPDLQGSAEAAVREGLARLERAHPQLRRDDSPLQAALVALDPWTGDVLALVGSRDYGVSQFNRATMARRQPGSAFKPIVALAALTETAHDSTFTLATLLADDSLAVETPDGLWTPANYDGQFRGSVTLRRALEQSLNVPFARLGLAVGPERIAAVGRSVGLESPLDPVPSLALGASGVTPLELTRAFGVLAAYGYRAPTRTTLGVLQPSGEPLDLDRQRGERVVPHAVAYLVTSALEGAVNRGTGYGLRRLGYDGAVAAKSGTTNNHRDAWFVGYTPSLAVGVWVGFDDNRSVGLPGSAAALPIFAQFLTGVPDEPYDFPVPAGIEIVEIDPATGLRAGPGCWGEREVFLEGSAPKESCSDGWRIDRALADGASWLARRLSDFGRWLGGNR